jgi:hypothetical protein
MNTWELQHRFNLEMEKFGVLHPVMSTIVEDYINYAYQQYVTEKYDSLINREEKFEITERISRILAPILDDFSTAVFVAITTNSPYGYYCTAPADLQYIIKESAVINYTDCNGNLATQSCKIVPIKHHMIESNKNNPFLKPEKDEIWRVNFSSNRIELILYSGVTLNTYSCRYMKKLTPVSFLSGAEVTIEIDDSVHEEIVVRAAYLHMADLRKQKTEENV